VQWRGHREGVVRQGLLSALVVRGRRALPAPGHTPAWLAVAWAALALVSLGVTLAGVGRFGGCTDLAEVTAWIARWNFGEANPYAVPLAGVDYPPSALIVLAPFAAANAAGHCVAFSAVHAVAAVLTGMLLAEWFAGLCGFRLSWSDRVALAAMFVCCQGTRTAIHYGQTSTFALAAIIGALMLARRRPIAAGVCLGVASYKLGVAAGAAVIVLLSAGVLPVAIGVLTALGLNAVAALSMHVSPAHLAAQYVARLSEVYYADQFVRSETGLRTLLTDVVASVPFATAATLAFGLVTLALIAWLARRGDRADVRRPAVVAATVLLWTLWASPHQTYDRVLMLPALWLIYWPGPARVRREWLRAAAAISVTLMLVAAVPAPIEYAAAEYWTAADTALGGWLNAVWPQRSRLLVLGLFAWALWRLWRTTGPASPPRPGISPASS
jgi:hypothetical protein